MKKKIVIFIDILTVILLAIQIQSMLVFALERFSRLYNYSWDYYLKMYVIAGIAHAISASSFEKLYFKESISLLFLHLRLRIIRQPDQKFKKAEYHNDYG